NSVAAALSAAKAGMGLAPLPCGLADLETDLVRIAPLPGEFTLDLWLLTHDDLRQTARIRAFLDFGSVPGDGVGTDVQLLLRSWRRSFTVRRSSSPHRDRCTGRPAFPSACS